MQATVQQIAGQLLVEPRQRYLISPGIPRAPKKI
jgi:hypothetical protein